MNKEAIYMMMLQVLDDPDNEIVIKIDTKIDEFLTLTESMCVNRIVCEDDSQYDCWEVLTTDRDRLEFKTNVELMEYLDSIEEIISGAYVESF